MNWMEYLGWDDSHINDVRCLGYSYLQQGKYDIAISFFEALNVLQPNNNYDLQALGALYLEKGNSLEAINFLNKSLSMDPYHLPTILNKTKALFSLGYKQEAISLAKKLLLSKDESIKNQANALLSVHT